MTLPLLDHPSLSRLVTLWHSCGTTPEHCVAVNVTGGGLLHSFRLRAEDAAEFERLREGVDDHEIFTAYRQSRTWREGE